MSFTNAPVSRSLVLGLVSTSIGASLFDVKHYSYILMDSHILRHHQFWRALTFQLCYTNSSEVLFACMALYQLRVVERLWGSRKYASFVAITYLLSSIVTPATAYILRALSLGRFNYLPAGPTAIVFAALAQYYAMVPHMYTYRIAFSTAERPAAESADDNFVGASFSDKSYQYFVAAQLALFQWPGSILSATVGWLVGHAWRNSLLPDRLTQWRLPGWVVGAPTVKRRDEFEGLRRRLEGENGAASGRASGSAASGSRVQQGDNGDAGRRRPVR